MYKRDPNPLDGVAIPPYYFAIEIGGELNSHHYISKEKAEEAYLKYLFLIVNETCDQNTGGKRQATISLNLYNRGGELLRTMVKTEVMSVSDFIVNRPNLQTR